MGSRPELLLAAKDMGIVAQITSTQAAYPGYSGHRMWRQFENNHGKSSDVVEPVEA